MPNPDEQFSAAQERENRLADLEAFNDRMKAIETRRRGFEQDFQLNYENSVDLPFETIDEKETFLSSDDIDKANKNNLDTGFSQKDIDKIKDSLDKVPTHDIRGMNLSDEQVLGVYARDYKRYFDEKIDKDIDDYKVYQEMAKEAIEVIAKFEKQKEPLFEKIKTLEEEIDTFNKEYFVNGEKPSLEESMRIYKVEQEKKQLQEEFDNFPINDEKGREAYNAATEKYKTSINGLRNCTRRLGNSFITDKTTGFGSSKFKEEFDNYRGNLRKMGQYFDKVDDMEKDIEKEKQIQAENERKAKEAEEKRIADEKAAEEKKIADEKAAQEKKAKDEKEKRRLESKVFDAEEMSEIKTLFEKEAKFTQSISKLENTATELLEGEQKEAFKKYCEALRNNVSAKKDNVKLEHDKNAFKDTKTCFYDGFDSFNRVNTGIKNESGLSIEQKSKQLFEDMGNQSIFPKGDDFSQSNEFAKKVGYAQAANRYFNNLQKPSEYTGPKKADYQEYYSKLRAQVGVLNDKLILHLGKSINAENIVNQLENKDACQKDININLINAAVKDGTDFNNKNIYDICLADTVNTFTPRIENEQTKAYLDAIDQIQSGNKDDFIKSLADKTKALNDETKSLTDARADVNKEIKASEKQTALNNYQISYQKYQKQNWFFKLFDAAGRRNLESQKNELKNQYGFSETQLDIAKRGSTITASQLSDIIVKAEKTSDNSKLFQDTIKKYKLNDEKLTNTFNAFKEEAPLPSDQSKPNAERQNESRHSIELNEVRDMTQEEIRWSQVSNEIAIENINEIEGNEIGEDNSNNLENIADKPAMDM